MRGGITSYVAGCVRKLRATSVLASAYETVSGGGMHRVTCRGNAHVVALRGSARLPLLPRPLQKCGFKDGSPRASRPAREQGTCRCGQLATGG